MRRKVNKFVCIAIATLSIASCDEKKVQPVFDTTNKLGYFGEFEEEMVRNPDGTTSEGLGDWDISRDAPYFGIEIPDEDAGKIVTVGDAVDYITARSGS